MKSFVSLVVFCLVALIGIECFAGGTQVEVQRKGLFGRRLEVKVQQPQKVVQQVVQPVKVQRVVQQVQVPVHVQEIQVQQVQKVQRVQQVVVPQYVQQVQQVQRVVVPVQKVQRVQNLDHGGCADFFN